MKIQVAKKDLEDALSVVSASMEGSGSDLSTHFLFRRSPDDRTKAQVLTYSGYLSSMCPFTSVVEESDFDAFTVEGWRLKLWMTALPDAALEFEFDGSVVEAFCPGKGKQRFQSLNPKFPFWDGDLATAQKTATLPADRLHKALDYARKFASDQETRTPELCVCEVKEGILASTNKRTATLVKVKGLENSAMRILAKDAPHILSFLNTINDDVDILEHEKKVFFRRGDGAIFVESRFDANFPVFNQPPDEDPHWWILDTKELREAIPILRSGASKEDDRMRFSRPEKDGPISISMLTATGSPATLSVKCLDSHSEPDAEEIPEDGFVLAYPNLDKILQFVSTDTVRFGISRRKKNGYLRFKEVLFKEEDGTGGDVYLTIAAWLR